MCIVSALEPTLLADAHYVGGKRLRCYRSDCAVKLVLCWVVCGEVISSPQCTSLCIPHYTALHCIYTCLVVGVLDVHLLSEILKILFSDTPAINGMTISSMGRNV